ncbi:hypothetical protein SDC9_123442 [bioreactor metagenome]|uniref:Uncharacterized protein n=1 Tax=bioreactor metagenome TaxID=1076179 RepID=A0A645CHT0_9ZZZZ
MVCDGNIVFSVSKTSCLMKIVFYHTVYRYILPGGSEDFESACHMAFSAIHKYEIGKREKRIVSVGGALYPALKSLAHSGVIIRHSVRGYSKAAVCSFQKTPVFADDHSRSNGLISAV